MRKIYQMKDAFREIEIAAEYEPLNLMVGITAAGEIRYPASGELAPARGIFVLDQKGNLHMGPRALHHNDLVAGEPILCAGEYNISKGKISTLNNRSGHYEPGADCLMYVVEWFRDRAVTHAIRLNKYHVDERGNFTVSKFKSSHKNGAEKLTPL